MRTNNLLDALQNMRLGNLEEVNNQMLWGMMKWLRGNKNTLHLMQGLNFNMKWNPQELTKVRLAEIVCKMPPYVRSPKPTKFSNSKYEVLAELLKRKYGWSSKELLQQRAIIINLLEDKEYLQELANESGMEDKELRKLGLKAVKAIKPKKQESKNLFSF